MDGIYFDYFTNHTSDCFNTDHGHPIAGGDYWSQGVHGLYEEVRAECKKLNPEFMLCAEDTAEWCIDVVDTVHTGVGLLQRARLPRRVSWVHAGIRRRSRTVVHRRRSGGGG